MKKQRVLLLCIVVFMPLFAKATSMTTYQIIDGINYVLSYEEKVTYLNLENAPDAYTVAFIPEYAWVVRNENTPYSGEIIIPDSVTWNGGKYEVQAINDNAFAGCVNLISVTLPNSVKRIEMRTFEGCTSLISVIIPYGVTYIGYGAFFGCSGLGELAIPESVEIISDEAFAECSSLTSVNIPNTVVSIGSYAFCNCTSLTSVVIGNSVTTIGSCAFSGCTGLTSVTIPNSVTSIKDDAFEDCKNAILYIQDDKNIEWYKEKFLSSVKDVVPLEKNNYNLTYYVDGKEYKKLQYKYDDEITPEAEPTKKGMIFSGWSNMPERMPGKDVDVTGTFSWYKTTKDNVIYEIADTINNYVTVIGNVDASGGVTIVSELEYDYIYIVTSIADNSFNGCRGITNIDMPATITIIGERAFAGIDKLTDVTIRAEEVPETDRTAFENSYIEDYVTLHVPGIAVKKYKETAPWKNFKEIVVIPGTEVIEKYKLTYMVDGEEYKVVEINEGEAVTPEDVPTKEGYTFSGWSNIPETMPGEDVTVSGTFTINKYKLVYMVDGQEYKTYDIEYNSAIDAEAAPTKEGYTFSGWSDIPETMPAKDVTVSGTFTVNKYKLTYTVDGESYKEYEVEYGSSITAESEPTKEGYTFSGWSDIPGTMPANDVTVTGTFTINKYTITYYVDGEVYKTCEIEYGSEISQEADPEKEGYDFSGWSWTPSKMPAEDVTVTGSFTKASYDVDGAKYEINDDGMTLTKADGASGDVVLDATVTINGKTYRITVIGEGAFEGNNNITSLTVPDGINTIMPNAFNGCGNLMKLILGKDVRYIGSKAFANIGSASARRRAASEPLVIECEAEYVPDADSDAFYGVDTQSAILKVNDELVNFYKTTSPWSSFSNIYGFSDTSSINDVFVNEEGAAIFSIDGRRLDTPQKGLNIIRTDKGAKKLYRK